MAFLFDEPDPKNTRRNFIMTMLASGFALAAQPVSAEMIKTDDRGLAAGDVKIPAKDGDIPAYRAMPATGNSFPIVLVVHEVFGVHEYIKDVCRRLAKLGYLAIAPALFARQGDVSKIENVADIVRNVVSKVSDEQVMSDLDATVAWAKATSKGDIDRLGITGFCWGGRIVWLYAAHSLTLKAGVAWYGRIVGDRNAVTPTYPIDIAGNLKAPVLGLYGEADSGIPIDTIERMRDELEKAGTKSDIVLYSDTPHAFHADYRASYRKDAAEDGWKRMQAWFKANGVA